MMLLFGFGAFDSYGQERYVLAIAQGLGALAWPLIERQPQQTRASEVESRTRRPLWDWWDTFVLTYFFGVMGLIASGLDDALVVVCLLAAFGVPLVALVWQSLRAGGSKLGHRSDADD